MPTDKRSYQSTDAENAKGPLPVSKPGDDLKVSQRGGLQDIARENYSGQQNDTGAGATPVGATINRNVKQ